MWCALQPAETSVVINIVLRQTALHADV